MRHSFYVTRLDCTPLRIFYITEHIVNGFLLVHYSAVIACEKEIENIRVTSHMQCKFEIIWICLGAGETPELLITRINMDYAE
jgi:hypothetical protein